MVVYIWCCLHEGDQLSGYPLEDNYRTEIGSKLTTREHALTALCELARTRSFLCALSL